MADISKLKVNETTYDIKDSTARSGLENKVEEAPFDGAEYVRKNGSWALSSGAGGAGATSAIYFYNQTVNVANNAEILRITDSNITPYVVVLECTFANPSYITSDVTWTSYDGYISFTGTCTAATTANVTLGILADGKVNKNGDTMTGTLFAKAGMVTDDGTTGGLNMNNSNIVGVNAIYTADPAEGVSEGINFYRDATHADTLWVQSGVINFVPNRTYGTNTTTENSQKVARFTSTPSIGHLVITNDTNGGISSPLAFGTEAGSVLSISTNTEGNFRAYRNDITIGTAPSDTAWVYEYNGYVKDKKIGYIAGNYRKDKKVETKIVSRNYLTNGNAFDNYLSLITGEDATYSVEIPVNAQTAWRNAILGDSEWITATHPNPDTYTGEIYYRKIGNIVYVTFTEISLKTARDSTGWTTLTTLPEGYRPTKSGFCQTVGTRISNQLILVYIYPSGQINVAAPYGMTFPTGAGIYTSISYPV